MAERQVRRDLVIDTVAEREKPNGDREATIWTTVSRRRRRSGMQTRVSCTRRCRKRGGSRSSSETSRKTKSSSGCWSGTKSPN